MLLLFWLPLLKFWTHAEPDLSGVYRPGRRLPLASTPAKLRRDARGSTRRIRLGAWSDPTCIRGKGRYPDQMMCAGWKALTFKHQAQLLEYFSHPDACLPMASVSSTV
ncbi:MAG: hypothetical protein AB1918_00655, partial [Pseudomonadota bacterium]